MLETTIKKASISDAQSIALIEKECFSVPWSVNSIKDTINSDSSLVLIAKSGENTVGYIGMYHSFGEADITNVAVLQQYRNKGFAKKLITELIGYCNDKGIYKVRLEVRKSNTPAISVYKSFGFYAVGIRKNYYSHPKEDAVLMDLDLETATDY